MSRIIPKIYEEPELQAAAEQVARASRAAEKKGKAVFTWDRRY
jgi:hypothetical protein